MKDRTSNIGLVVGLLGLLATNCTTDTSGTETTSAQDAAVRYERALQGASISLAEAIGIAQGAYPDGTVIEAEFELEEGVPAFEVEIALADGSTIEVRIDPESGDILSAEADDDDDHSGPGHDGADDDGDDDHGGSGHDGDDGAGGAADDADDDHGNAGCPSAVSRAEAIVAAEAASGAHAVEVEFEDCEFEVLVVKDGELREVDVAADGTVLGVEAHDGDDDDDDGAQDDDHGDGDDDGAGGSADVDDDHGDSAGQGEQPDDDHSSPDDSAGSGDSDEPDDDHSGTDGGEDDDGAGGEHP